MIDTTLLQQLFEKDLAKHCTNDCNGIMTLVWHQNIALIHSAELIRISGYTKTTEYYEWTCSRCDKKESYNKTLII